MGVKFGDERGFTGRVSKRGAAAPPPPPAGPPTRNLAVPALTRVLSPSLRKLPFSNTPFCLIFFLSSV